MNKKLIAILFFIALSLFSIAQQQVSLGVGLNNVQTKYSNYHQRVVSTNYVLAGDYNYTFKNNVGLRASIAHASFDERIIFSSIEDFVAVRNSLAFNIGPMYHFLNNKKLDLSSGFSLGRQMSWFASGFGNPNIKRPLSFYVYSINLLNVKYYPFNEKIGFYGEVIIDDSYLSNYFLGLVYQF